MPAFNEHLLRDLAPRVLGRIARRFADFSAAEDAVQEALLAAATQWPSEGVPLDPCAWLTTVASRRMTDRIRAEIARRRREASLVMQALPEDWVAAPRARTRIVAGSGRRLPTAGSDCQSHDEAARADLTVWSQILGLYGLWLQVTENPMVTLNHAVAAAMVHKPAHGLALLESLDADPRIARHHRLAAVRAHFFERLGNVNQAVTHYRDAAANTTSTAERNYLLMKAARLANLA